MSTPYHSHSNDKVNFVSVTDNGPALCHHTAVMIGGSIYIHGGVEIKGSTKPVSTVHRLTLNSLTWETFNSLTGPTLSHHAAVAIHERYMVLIGGWNGRCRTSDVFILDTEGMEWMRPRVSGFPVGAGLSSHTATLLKTGDILVVGREGSLRIQRRSGNAFMLTGDVQKGAFKYTDYPIGVASRSGHTSNVIGSTLVIVGGRDDKLVEQHANYHAANASNPAILSELCHATKGMTAMSNLPGGRKHHVTAGGSNCLLVHGGETFDGRSRGPVAEVFLALTQTPLTWYQFGVSGVGREGHVCCCDDANIYIHGGSGHQGKVFGDCYKLTLHKVTS